MGIRDRGFTNSVIAKDLQEIRILFFIGYDSMYSLEVIKAFLFLWNS